jgi:uncharacterized protein|tara:strand:- start:140 stop:418 length:279 start_codon:yes stop_codon:yes gene_type:complete
MVMLCSIYRSPKKEGMYLYVEKKEGLGRLPESLLKIFGKPKLAMTLLLKPERKLARVDREDVIKGITEQGFYLQMPPKPEDRYNNDHNTKLV